MVFSIPGWRNVGFCGFWRIIMVFWHRAAWFFCRPLTQFAVTSLVAVGAAVIANTAPVQAATRPFTLSDQPTLQTSTIPLPLIEPDWLAIEDSNTGYAITLAAKWREAPESPAHEQEVIRTNGWYFSRLFDCARQDCGSYVRAIVSGGILQANINIQNYKDLKDQMPARDITRLVASIAGVASIGPDELQPIKRAGAFGYRVRTSRPQENGEAIALVIDCLYHGKNFLILTAATPSNAQEIGALSLDAIARGITASSQDASSAAKATAPR